MSADLGHLPSFFPSYPDLISGTSWREYPEVRMRIRSSLERRYPDQVRV